jgi:E3 ubiquitin-protein ligase ZNF598
LSKSAFPELPTTAVARVPKGAIKGNQSLKNILGNTTPPAPVWEGGSKSAGPSTPAGEGPPTGEVDGGVGAAGGNGKKKGKGKGKQTLFTLGSFPT